MGNESRSKTFLPTSEIIPDIFLLFFAATMRILLCLFFTSLCLTSCLANSATEKIEIQNQDRKSQGCEACKSACSGCKCNNGRDREEYEAAKHAAQLALTRAAGKNKGRETAQQESIAIPYESAQAQPERIPNSGEAIPKEAEIISAPESSDVTGSVQEAEEIIKSVPEPLQQQTEEPEVPEEKELGINDDEKCVKASPEAATKEQSWLARGKNYVSSFVRRA